MSKPALAGEHGGASRECAPPFSETPMPVAKPERKAIYEKRKNAGVCPTPGCGNDPYYDEDKGVQRVHCLRCLTYQSLAMGELIADRKKRKVCIRCEAKLNSLDRKKKHVKCVSCRKEENKINRERQAAFRANGLCQFCGKPGKVRPDGRILVLCPEHHKKKKAYDDARAEKKAADAAYRASLRKKPAKPGAKTPCSTEQL